MRGKECIYVCVLTSQAVFKVLEVVSQILDRKKKKVCASHFGKCVFEHH